MTNQTQRVTRGSLLFLSCVLLSAVPAFSQSTDGPTEVKRYVAASGGAAMLPTRETPVLAGEYGEAVTPFVFAYVNYSYYDDLMSQGMRDNLSLAAADFEARSGLRRSFTGRDRGLSLTMGGKLAVKTGTPFRPYVGAGAGVLHLRRTITEAALGDVTKVYLTESLFQDGLVNAGTQAALKPMVEGLAGLNVFAGRAYLDLAYKYRRAYHVNTLDFSQLSASVGIAF